MRRLRFRTNLTRIERDASIYAPGTVDTIFRNNFTGEERVVTTDTVNGTIRRRFQQFNALTAVGLPVELGYIWPVGRSRVNLSGGLRTDYFVGRSGRTVTEAGAVVPVAERAAYRERWQFGYRLSGQLTVPIARRRLQIGLLHEGGFRSGGRVYGVSFGLR